MPLRRSARPGSQHSTPWKKLKVGPQILLEEITSLYWVGVERDLHDILRALQVWGQTKYSSAVPPGPRPHSNDWHGFESFVKRATKEDSSIIADDILSKINAVHGVKSQYSKLERMAQMMLQAAGFLDIDKIVEYKPPQFELGVWLRPRAPQLETSLFQKLAVESAFQVANCSQCSEPIRGSRFRSVEGSQPPIVLCETCARNQIKIPDKLTKLQKNCILSSSISDQQAHELCSCARALGRLQRGQLYPFRIKDRDLHEPNCPLLKLAAGHCKAKYSEVVKQKQLRDPITVESTNIKASPVTNRRQRKGHTLGSSSTDAVESNGNKNPLQTGRTAQLFSKAFNSLKKIFSRSRPSTLSESVAEDSSTAKSSRLRLPGNSMPSTHRVMSAVKRTAMRPAVQQAVKEIPFGNVHMALMIGPLVIENGIPDSKAGALITTRDRLQLLPVGSWTGSALMSLAVGHDKLLWKAPRPHRKRRIKAFMKQVVGGAFCEMSNERLEDEIIKDLAQQSINCFDDQTKPPAYIEAMRSKALRGIMLKLKNLLQNRVQYYLKAIINRLFDPEVPLAWHETKNHCQKFCETIIDRRVFGSLLAKRRPYQQPGSIEPLYLISFVCRSGSLDGFPKKVSPLSKFAVPNGFTEEYLLRYRRYGHHNESDIIDTLMEYWTDWGAFPGPIFPHQDLFPWDCTEAHSKDDDASGEIKCGNCNIAKHLWAFPFDSWSIIQLHLHRDRRFYPSASTKVPALSDPEWASNRFKTLQALQILNRIAVGMTKSSSFRAKCRWSTKSNRNDFPHLEHYAGGERGIQKASPEAHSSTDRVKLGGIFRAQPKSHLFEHGKFHDCTLASWADLVYEDQVAAYKKFRDYRASDLEGIHKAGSVRRVPSELTRHPERMESPQRDDNRQDWLEQIIESARTTNDDIGIQSNASSSQELNDIPRSFDDSSASFNFSIGDTDDDSIYSVGEDGTYDGTEAEVYFEDDNPDSDTYSPYYQIVFLPDSVPDIVPDEILLDNISYSADGEFGDTGSFLDAGSFDNCGLDGFDDNGFASFDNGDSTW